MATSFNTSKISSEPECVIGFSIKVQHLLYTNCKRLQELNCHRIACKGMKKIKKKCEQFLYFVCDKTSIMSLYL